MALTIADKKVNILFSMIDDTHKTLQNIEGNMNNLNNTVGESQFSVGKMVKGFLASEIVLKAWSTVVQGATAVMGYLKESLYAGAELERLNEATIKIGENMGYSKEQIMEMVYSLEDVNTYGSNATKAVRALLQSGLLPMVAGLERVDTQTGKNLQGMDAFIIAIKDLAANAGISSGDAIDVMTDAIATQNTEMLKQFGLMIDLGELYGANADELDGLSGEALILRKRQMLLNEVMQQSINFAGVYSATYDTAGKNMLSFEDVTNSLKEQIGLGLQPAFKEFTNTALELGKGLRDLIMTEEFQGFLNGVSTAIATFSEGFKEGFASHWEAIKIIFKDELVPAVEMFIESLYDVFGLEGEQRTFADLMGEIGRVVGEFSAISLVAIIQAITVLAQWLITVNNKYMVFKQGVEQASAAIKTSIESIVNPIRLFLAEIEKAITKWKQFRDATKSGSVANVGGVLAGIIQGSFASGIKNVPQDMIAVIHKGEAVVPAKQNPYNPTSGASSTTTMGNIVINNPVVDSNQRLNDLVNKVKKAVESSLVNQNNAARLGYYNSL